jgi:hypothetical protein
MFNIVVKAYPCGWAGTSVARVAVGLWRRLILCGMGLLPWALAAIIWWSAPSFCLSCWLFFHKIQLLMVDILATRTMKDAAKCDK